MKKRCFISSILLFAFAISFSHSIIPHHHHDEEWMEHHITSHNDDGDDIDHDFLGQAFSHLQHDGSIEIIYETTAPSFQVSKLSLHTDSYLLFQYAVRLLYEPPMIHFEKPSISFYFSSCPVTQLLRGPPAKAMA